MAEPSRQRAFAMEIVEKLRAAGFEALWAGGCVRDQLLGLVPKDYDVATSATPDQIRDLFGRRRTVPIGVAFGVVTVLDQRIRGRPSSGPIEVATFRADAAYSDGRHPDAVTFTTAERDAQRRDFTINGLFFDPIAGKVVDYVGGQLDLERRIIRAIGDPRLRLAEDKLRMLRAVRFAATFEFEIEPETFRTIQNMAADITTVSPERIGMEIRRMLLDANRARAMELLRQSKLLSSVLPELDTLSPGPRSDSSWPQMLIRLKRLRKPTLPLALATLLLFVEGANVHEVGRRLRLTNKEIDRTAWLLENLNAIARAPTEPWSKLQRILIHDGAAELIALHETSSDFQLQAVAYCRERLAWPSERLNPPPLIDGSDLIRHGLTPGPQFAALLEQVREAQLEGRISSHDEGLALVERLLSGRESVP